jgi:hypothetical protein
MNSKASYASHHETISLPVVRIDTLDENYSLPLREFFNQNGCQVFINASPSPHVSYQLIVGDWNFVKRITETLRVEAQKTLILLWETHPEDASDFIKANRKIALIDPIPLTPDLLSGLLTYFFVEEHSVKNFQKSNPIKRQVVDKKNDSTKNSPKLREELRSAGHAQDAKRIAHTITSIFSPNKPTIKPTSHKKILRNKYGTLFLILFLFITLPVVYSNLSFIGSIGYLYQGSLCLRSGKMDCVSKSTTASRIWLTQSRQSFQFISSPMTLLGFEQFVKPYELWCGLVEKLIAIEETTSEISDSANTFALSFFPTISTSSSDTGTVVEVEKMKTKLFVLQTDLDLAYVLLTNIIQTHPFPMSLPPFNRIILRAATYLTKFRDSMNTVDKLLMLYPYVSGYKEPMTALVLLQNSAELRPTGGFIGSLMNITIADGKITGNAIEDVYAVDGQLRGHIDPPTPIVDLLNQEHWYLRDSNWDPDFRESAKRALWFYEKETGKTPQGVIGITTSLIVKLLELTGPIKLVDFNDQISASNFYAKALFYTQENFFPGSTQKKDFLGSLFVALTNALMGDRHLSGIDLFELFQSGLRERNIQLYFVHDEAQQLVNQFAWSGSLPTRPLCTDTISTTVCLTHYVHINEANLGVNKVNYFIKRQDRRDITIEESGKVTEVLTRTIMNASTGEPGTGTYRVYTRMFVPKDAHITSFMLDGVPVATKDVQNKQNGEQLVLPYGELDTTSYPGHTVLGAAIDVPSGYEHTIRVTYNRTFFGIQSARTIYMELYEQKQSGVDSVPTLIRLRYPQTWQAEGIDAEDQLSLANTGYLEYNSSLLQDLYIKVLLKK